MIRTCWRCRYPFSRVHVHKATQHGFRVCANDDCSAPWDISDEAGIRIMEAEDAPGARAYAQYWREVLVVM